MRTEDLLSLPTVCVGALSADGTRARAGRVRFSMKIGNTDLSISHVLNPPCVYQATPPTSTK